ncbi:cation:proton antiporter [Bowmanella sp. JS7-9]|uniref:Cation:proton antiporter n=1 Tax=Pseudobowmanella zhangzhouensis TaxID=1537679 RepID=A0ABW1XHG3_9ALTE|nr:sodium:proton exchanger [Bowmanella sp. JS7-9]
MQNLTLLLVMVGLLSIGCQYLAYRIKVPAILPLLVTGILVGPVFGVMNADAIFGDLLFPIVSLSVAIILFEGSLTLKLTDLGGHGKMVRNLCTVGALVTWLVVSWAAHATLALSWQIAFLFGAIVTVTGPTVIVPMLRSIRPSAKVSNILRWEGIIIDPIGALLAVLVYEFVVATQDAFSHTLLAFGATLVTGFALGSMAGYGLGVVLRKNWVPHYLRNTAVLTIILGVFALSNVFAHESGLLTVTIAGMWLANMKDVEVDDIIEFKETLSVLLISALFILLATRIELSAITDLRWSVILLLLVILFVARPLSVVISSIGAGLKWQEVALLSWIAPRGIVAAAVSALFALQMEAQGFEEAKILVPLVFLVIIVTVVLQSLTSVTIARLLGERAPPPIGYLIFGGNEFCRLLAKELINHDIPVRIADTNWNAIRHARMENIPTYFGNPMSSHASRVLDMAQFGTVLVMSPYKQLNPLVTYHFQYYLGKEAVYALTNNEQDVRPSHQVSEQYAKRLSLFGEGVTYARLASMVSKGATIKTTGLSENFTEEDYNATYGERAQRLLAINPQGRIQLYTMQTDIKPKADWKIVSLILPEAKQDKAEPESGSR